MFPPRLKILNPLTGGDLSSGPKIVGRRLRLGEPADTSVGASVGPTETSTRAWSQARLRACCVCRWRWGAPTLFRITGAWSIEIIFIKYHQSLKFNQVHSDTQFIYESERNSSEIEIPFDIYSWFLTRTRAGACCVCRWRWGTPTLFRITGAWNIEILFIKISPQSEVQSIFRNRNPFLYIFLFLTRTRAGAGSWGPAGWSGAGAGAGRFPWQAKLFFYSRGEGCSTAPAACWTTRAAPRSPARPFMSILLFLNTREYFIERHIL